MRVLVNWDDPDQADLIHMYLNVDENGVVVCRETDKFVKLLESQQHWDAILLPTAHPDHDTAFEIFSRARDLRPETPIVAACDAAEVYRIARYLTAGLRSYVIRDKAGDFMFLLQAIIEGAIKSVEAERERLVAEKLRQEIDSVRKLQQSIIPRNLAKPLGYDIVARYESSQIRVIGGRPVTLAGGDYYDAFALSEDCIVLIVGDASGHGMKACMSIMTMHTLIRMIRDHDFRDTAKFVARVNDQLCEQTVVNDDGGFITMIYGILNPLTNELKWTSAGHPMPIVQNLATNETECLDDHDAAGLPLGIVPGADYTTQTTSIPWDTRVLLYTDGIVEAFPGDSPGHAEFGISGLETSLKSSQQEPLGDALQGLFDDSLAFTGGVGRHDDTSVLMIERHREETEETEETVGEIKLEENVAATSAG